MGFFSGLIDGVGDVVGDVLGGAKDLLGPISTAAGWFTGQPWLQYAGSALSGLQSLGSAVAPFAPLVSGYAGMQGQQEANQQNIELAQKQMDFQREMAQRAMEFGSNQAARQMDFQASTSNYAWRNAVYDMQQAGLNPMLAYMKGGAQAGAGARAEGVAPGGQTARVENTIAAGLASAGSAAQVANLQASARKMDSEAMVNEALVPKIAQEVRTSAASASHYEAMVQEILQKLPWLERNERQKISNLVAEAFRDESAAQLMRQEARESGAREDEIRARIPGTKAISRKEEYSLTRARKEMEAHDTWYGTIAPYLPDILKGTSTAAGAAAAYSLGRSRSLGLKYHGRGVVNTQTGQYFRP